MANSAGIRQAIIAKLLGDATLAALATGGVWRVTPQGVLNYVLVSQVDSEDVGKFGGRAYEDKLFMVKAVFSASSSVSAAAAAARIDVLLEDQPLTASGYTWMATFREGDIDSPETDDVDPSIRYQHLGGFYRVQFSVGS